MKAQLEAQLTAARKSRDKLRTTVLSSTLAELRNAEIEAGGTADDEMVKRVLTRALKQRREAAEQMRVGGREELAEREEQEAEILGVFLPPPLSEYEVREMVREIVAAGASQMGAVMGRLMPRIQGRFDGREANRIVREELGD
ncbi:MAG: GatB/YqeY domain-containing protein [Gemmatimonadales bacterium]|nr:MAG: GatB/YqeY domain-containing protein [Gemmatimonadales bacterium]